MTATVSRAPPSPAPERRAPCVAVDGEGRHCVAALLHGATCCPHGDCPQCEEQLHRMRLSGFPEQAVARSWLHTQVSRSPTCPVCGLPAPPAADRQPPLPRLPRTGRTHSGSWACRTCGRPLPRRRRHYCSHACWREHVRGDEMEGTEIRAPERSLPYRVHLGGGR